jgi:hypothetical protein
VTKFSAATGQKDGGFPLALKPLRAIALSWDGTTLAAVGNRRIEVWDVGAERREVDAAFPTSSPDNLAIGSDGRVVAFGGDLGRDITLQDPKGERPTRTITNRAAELLDSAFAPGGERLAVLTIQKGVIVWDLRQGGEAYRVPGWRGVAFSPDSALLATAVPDPKDGKNDTPAVILYDARTGQPAARLQGASFPIAFHPTKPIVAAANKDHVQIWDYQNLREVKVLRTLEEHGSDPDALSFASEGELLASVNKKALTLSRIDNGKVEAHHGGKWYPPAVFSPDGKILVAGQSKERERERDGFIGSDGPPLGLWDVATGKRLRDLGTRSADLMSATIFPGARGQGDQVYVSPEGRPVSAARNREYWAEVLIGHSTVRIYKGRPGAGTELATLVSFRDGGWAVADPAGRYDGSNGGDVDGLHWVVGTEPIELGQLKDRYYDPDLLAKHVALSPQPLREVAALTAPRLHPAVIVSPPTPTRPSVSVTLTDRGGGFGRVVVLVNGKEVREVPAGALPRGTDPKVRALSVDLANDPRVEPGKENRVAVVAYNEDGYLRSRDAEAVFVGPGVADARPPELWVVAAGVSDYVGTALDLKYAAKDARDFAKALGLAGGRLFGADGTRPERVHLSVLTTLEADPARRPTKANLVRELKALKGARPGDVVVVYLSGHGVSRKEGDAEEYYFLTADARSADLADEGVRKRDGLSGAELRARLAASPARKQVLVLDTCASGRAVDRLAERRAVPGEQMRALERVKDRAGTFVLAGCASDAVSYEAGRYAQGVLTYALLLGMKSELVPGGEVNVGELFKFAVDRVPELAGHIGGVQRPQVGVPRAGSPFPIGLLNATDRNALPIERERPLVQRTGFLPLGDDAFDDELGLGKRVDEAFRTATGRGAGGPAVVFVDAKEVAGAARVLGRYKVDGGKVSVRVKVYEGKAEVAAFEVAGEEAKPGELAAKIADEAEKRLTNRK